MGRAEGAGVSSRERRPRSGPRSPRAASFNSPQTPGAALSVRTRGEAARPPLPAVATLPTAPCAQLPPGPLSAGCRLSFSLARGASGVCARFSFCEPGASVELRGGGSGGWAGLSQVAQGTMPVSRFTLRAEPRCLAGLRPAARPSWPSPPGGARGTHIPGLRGTRAARRPHSV